MGNTHVMPWSREMKPTDANAMFHALDVHANSFLTLKDLMAASTPGLMMPHSLPALYFFDKNKDGRLTEPEFAALVYFCQSEKRKVEQALAHDKTFRDLILRASKAGVKDCSVHGRSYYRRLSSYSTVRSVFSSRTNSSFSAPSSGIPPRYPPSRAADQPVLSCSPSDSSDDATQLSASPAGLPCDSNSTHGSQFVPAAESSVSSENDEPRCEAQRQDVCDPAPQRFPTIAMYCSQREFAQRESEPNSSDPELRDPKNRTALDAAVIENIILVNIHKLADLLHTEGSREEFMAWLWNLIDFNASGVVTLEELRVLLAALSDDGIDLAELAFYKEGDVPLEESIINEFDTTHAGMLSRDEFMVLADLVTREYEFWENRHMERIGDYELGRTIGRGSSGVVRLAIHVETRQKVAIKIIKKGKCSDLSRLDREIQSLMAARHRHIVALEEVLDSESNLFIVMELCGGGSMVDIVRLYPEERMPEETARFFVRQVFEALAFCHRNGICHRDIRLDNLMLDNAGNIKITDFGHSGVYTPGWDIFSTSLVGSVYNLSPEQIMGQCYSGEKIDTWSAGVVVYCLLVGRPPFFEPEVNALLERIVACDFELPDFLSENAKDFIQCMIRAVPEERISMQQMLHHPWFYDGPEFGPSMDVVGIPVDAFFKKRPDIAEMIMAITIYQHSLHFHLADTQNPSSSPEDQRGQDWTLKCLCPKNDIKFTVSLFTKKPYSVKKKKRNGKLTSAASMSLLTGPAVTNCTSTIEPAQADTRLTRGKSDAMRRQGSVGRALEDFDSAGTTLPAKNLHERSLSTDLSSESSGSRPPRLRRIPRITPMRVAAQLRDHASAGLPDSDSLDDVFDIEPDARGEDFGVKCSHNDTLGDQDKSSESTSAIRTEKERLGSRSTGRHMRSHSLDEAGSLMRINRSATVDAFPYQKVYPPRKMPESARNLSFDRPGSPPLSCPDASTSNTSESSSACEGKNSSKLRSFHRSVTVHAVTTFVEDSDTPGRDAQGPMDKEISQELSRHPSKAISPQSPQVIRLPMSHDNIPDNVEHLCLSACGNGCLADCETSHRDDSTDDSMRATEAADFQPYIEVRLQDGESGVFLKICRKLKTICATKLAAAAERQNKRTGGRRSLSALRRTASPRSMGAELGSNPKDLHRGTDCRSRRDVAPSCN